jgi:hypothetical protein
MHLPEDLSKIGAPRTVRASLSRPAEGNALHLHLVNYNRTEPETKRSPGGGIADEKPIATPTIACEIVVPGEWKSASARLLTPELEQPQALKAELVSGRLRFDVPSVLVYGVVELRPAQ